MTVTVRNARTAPDFEQFRELAVEYEGSLDPGLRHAHFASELVALREHYTEPNAVFVAAVDAVGGMRCVVQARRFDRAH